MLPSQNFTFSGNSADYAPGGGGIFNHDTDILYNTKYNDGNTGLTIWSQGSTDYGDWTLTFPMKVDE